MSKRVNYMQLLKESVANPNNDEHDTSKSVDVKGPFLDPILGYDGGGELPTHKDASSILERYYFKGNSDPGVRINNEETTPVAEDATIPQVGGDKGALDDEPESVEKSKKDIEDAVLMDENDEVENAVIERLIAEMEESEKPAQDPAAKNHEASGDPDKDAESLITGDAHDKAPPAAKIKEDESIDLDLFDDLLEDDDVTAGGEETPDDKEEKEEKEEDLDVDKKMGAEEVKESGAPVGNPKTADEDDLSEAFDIFNEAMEEEDEADEAEPTEIDEKDIMV